MLRIAVLLIFAALAAPAVGQVLKQDESLQEQLVPESFKFEASAVASKADFEWRTTISYAISNNSGMNLYLGILQGGGSIGSCTNAQETHGTLQILPPPGAIAYSTGYGSGGPHGVFVPAGGRASGTIIIADCSAPNPDFPTAPVSISLLAAKTPAWNSMISFPLSADAPIRQMRGD